VLALDLDLDLPAAYVVSLVRGQSVVAAPAGYRLVAFSGFTVRTTTGRRHHPTPWQWLGRLR